MVNVSNVVLAKWPSIVHADRGVQRSANPLRRNSSFVKTADYRLTEDVDPSASLLLSDYRRVCGIDPTAGVMAEKLFSM